MLVAGSALAADSHPGETLRGKLVLGDPRLNGFDVEAKGRFTAPDRFPIDPIHTRALLFRQGGKLRMITYWCDTCSIRSFTPGPCVCCQRETTLDLHDPDEL